MIIFVLFFLAIIVVVNRKMFRRRVRLMWFFHSKNIFWLFMLVAGIQQIIRFCIFICFSFELFIKKKKMWFLNVFRTFVSRIYYFLNNINKVLIGYFTLDKVVKFANFIIFHLSMLVISLFFIVFVECKFLLFLLIYFTLTRSRSTLRIRTLNLNIQNTRIRPWSEKR